MNPIYPPLTGILIAAMVGSWIAGTLMYRDHPWSLAGWFPLTALSGIGTLAVGGLLLESCGGSSGAGGGFAAMGMAGLLVLLLPCPLFFGMSLYIRPQCPHSDWALLVASLVTIAFLVVGWRALKFIG